MDKEITKELLDFIDRSPSCYHVIDNIAQLLEEAGFQRLEEGADWDLKSGETYYVTRNDSSLIGFRLPKKMPNGYRIMASHSDSPAFKIKENPEMEVEQQYIKLNVEKYGGMICSTWFDRPLSVAGRVLVSKGDRIVSKRVRIDKDLLMIPNLAIHMNREANEGYKYNAQKDMLPVFSGMKGKGAFLKEIAKAASVAAEDILGMDLFLYNRMKGTCWGLEEEFVAAPRLDDIQCAFGSLKGFLQSEANESDVQVFSIFDNEETGSRTKQGAASGFLKSTLKRINMKLGGGAEEYMKALANSFMISADNAHGVHPNHTEKTDPTNRPYLNGGIVIKHHANQQYTTDGVSAAVMKKICQKAEVPVQTFINRSDMAGGSTLGNISSTQVPVNTVDIGLAQWAMHSAYETAGAKDTYYLIKAAETFYSNEYI